MSCVVSNIDQNGIVKANPTESAIINTVDESFNSELPTKAIYKILQSSGYVLTNGKLNTPILSDSNNMQGLDTTAIESLMRLNMHFAINYGAINPVFNIQNRSRPQRDTEFLVSINEDQLSRLNRNAARTQNSQTIELESRIIQTAVTDQMNRLNVAKDTKQKDMPVTEIQDQDISEQIKSIQNSFARQGVEVKVEIDPELPVKGRIIVEPGKATVIKLNPTLMTEDTHVHEFSHLLVELLGEDNPVVKAAIKEVTGTELYAEVKRKYPELNGIALDKEVIVTAIGLAGVKINRNNPNKFQRILNKIFRALAKALNLQTNETAVEELAKTLMEGRFDSAMFKGSLKFLMADSRIDDKLKEDFDKVLADVKITVLETIEKLQRAKDGQVVNEKAVARLELMMQDLDKIKKIEQLIDFVAYAARVTDAADMMLDEINQEYPEDGKMATEDRLVLINKLHKVGDMVSTFYGGTGSKDSLMSKIGILVESKKKILNTRLTLEQRATDPGYQSLTRLEKSLSDSIYKMNIVSNSYNELGIPMMADLLLEYNNTDVDDQITSIINNIKTNRRLIAPDKNEEWGNLTKQNKDGVITDAELFEAQLALNVKQMENKRIGRETLIAELREAQKDKSAFSYLLDPIVYSSQASLQMFALTLKNKMYEANDDTQDVAYRVADAYRKYAESKGESGINPNTFNEEILEVHDYNITDPETGERKKTKILTFVQPLDITAYRKAEGTMYTTLSTQYGIPSKRDDRNAWFQDKANRVSAAKYYSDVADWYAVNSEPSPDSTATLARLNNDLINIENNLSAATQNNDGDRMAYYEAQKQEVKRLKNKIYDSNKRQFKGDAVQPLASKYTNPKYTALQSNGPAFEYYTALLDEYKLSQKQVGKNGPIRNSWEKFSYATPSILSDGLEKMQKDGAINYVKLETKDSFNFMSTDTHYGDSINANKEARNKTIPIFYVNPIDEKLATRDMASAIVQFAGMSNMYARKAEIQGAVMIMRDVVEKRQTLAVNSGSSPIINRFSKIIKYNKQVVNDDPSNNFKHLAEFIDTIFFGEEELKSHLSTAAKAFSLNKAAGKLAGFTALNNLAFNVLQSTNQVLLDNVRLIEEGVAGQFFSKSDLAWAKSVYHLQLQGIGQIKDYEKFVPSGKMGQAVRFFDGLGDTLSDTGVATTGPVAIKAITKLPMMLQGIMENETAVTRMLALMKSYEGKLKDAQGNVINNADGKPANLWDVFILDEKTKMYKIDPKVAGANAIRDRFRMKVSGLTKKTNQVKNKYDDAILQRRWYGKLIMLFRRYFIPSLRRYYGSGSGVLGAGVHRDLELGTVSEGMLHTTFRFAKEAWNKKGNVASVYGAMENFEKQNIKRFGVQATFIALCILLVASLSDDDEEETYAEEFLIYQALRMQSELTQFENPMEFVKMAQSPTATVRPLEKMWELGALGLRELGGMVTGNRDGLDYQRRSGKNEKGDNKFIAKLEELIPIVGGIEKSRTPAEAAKWFNLGAGNVK